MRKLLLLLPLLVLTAAADEHVGFAYIYNHDGQMHMHSNGDDIESLVRTSKRWKGEYVWLRKDRRQYLIRDAGVLAQVRAAFAEMHALEPKLNAAERRRDPFEAKIDAVEDRVDRLSDSLGDDEMSDAKRAQLEAQLRVAEQELRALERSLEPIERETEALEERMDRLEAVAERKFETIVLQAIRDGRAEAVR
jgi:chromosome segregation ATPase